MYKKISKILGVAIILAGFAMSAFSESTISKYITATVPAESGFGVTITQVPADDDWDNASLVTGNTMSFGTLTHNTEHNIFTASHYFAIDVTAYNTGGNFSIAHSTSTITNTTTNDGSNLDNNVNVTFVQQLDSLTEGWKNKYSFANSGRTYTKTENLPEGWLRIYYGIATESDSILGTDPIGTDKAAGDYRGSIILTFTTS